MSGYPVANVAVAVITASVIVTSSYNAAGSDDWRRELTQIRLSDSELRAPQIAQGRSRTGNVDQAPADEATPDEGEQGEDSAADIARKITNPLGGDIIIGFNFLQIEQQQGDIADKNQYAYTYQFQPVLPIRLPALGEHWLVVNRPTISYNPSADIPSGPDGSKKPGISEFNNRSGWADTEYFALLGTSVPTKTGRLAEWFGEGDRVLAAGFTTRWPTGKKSLSENVYAAGPAASAAYIGKDWIFASLFQHWWDYAEENGADDFNFSRVQLVYLRNLPGAWQIGGTPFQAADWSESGDDRWTVQVGLGVFKTVFLGKLPVRMGVEFRPSIISPDAFGTDWNIEFSFTPVVPNFVDKWFNPE